MSIEKIVVKIGDEEVTLTLEEARALWADLDEIFQSKAATPYVPIETPWLPWVEDAVPVRVPFDFPGGPAIPMPTYPRTPGPPWGGVWC